jgi:PKD repeat protein
MKKTNFIYSFTLAAIVLLGTIKMQAQDVYERLVIGDAFANEQPAQVDNVQNDGIGTLYVKNQSAGQRETFFKITLDDMDNLEDYEVDYAKVELRYYSFRTGQSANTNQISVYPVADNTWDETELTWTNSRELSSEAMAAGAIASATGVRIAGYSGSGQQGTAGAIDAYNAENVTRIDISSYAIQQYKLGIKTISVMLHVNNDNGNGDQQIANRELAETVSDYELKRPKIIVTQPIPTASFAKTRILYPNEIQEFKNTSILATSYAWNFGDGATSTDENPTHAYAESGSYTVRLTIDDDVENYMERTVLVSMLQGGNCEAADRSSWTEFGANGLSGGTNDQLRWGWTGGTTGQSYSPTGFSSGGFLVACEDWANNTVYKITQQVSLNAGSYNIDFDFAIMNFSNYTGKVYIGATVPTDAVYTDNQVGDFIATGYTTGDANKQHFNQLVNISTDGDYYLVIEWANTGTNGYFNTSIDNIALTQIVTPVPDFTVPTVGFVGEAVQFTNTSANAVSYAWDFGDEETGTDENPSHTYAAPGIYTVTLTLDGNNDYTIAKDIIICVLRDETLAGSDMEFADMPEWNIAGAGTFGSGSATWGNTEPSEFGTDGYLYLQETNGAATQYYIWQAVQLREGGRYVLSFDYTKSTFLKAWGEVYIGTASPGGSDYSDGGSRGEKPMAWKDAEANTGTFVDGQYSFTYDCPADGVYFFVIKVGANGPGKFLFGLDNVTLTKILDPIADFTAPAYGFVGVPVQFTDNSLNSTSYSWTFGDDETSADENPSYTFAGAGTYEVTLTTSGAGGTSAPTSKTIKIYPVHSESITGTMDADDRDNWIETGAKNITNTGNDKLIWGYDGAHNPEGFALEEEFFGDGGYLTVCEGWGGADSYKIAQAVSLTVGNTYDISLDYALGWYNRTRGEVYLGTAAPSAGLYTDNLLGAFLPYAEDNPSGNTTLQHLAAKFNCEVTGIYYFVIQWETGIGGDAGFRSAIDNVTLRGSITGLSPVENNAVAFANGGRICVKSAVSANRIDIYNAMGQLVLSEKVNSDYYESKALPSGLYLVNVNSKVYKLTVR